MPEEENKIILYTTDDGKAQAGGTARWGHRALPSGNEIAMPVRKRMDHRGPLSIDVSSAWYFITICAEGHRPWVGRDDLIAPFNPFAALLSTARHFQKIGKWRLALFLVMPDHVHFIVNISSVGAMGPSRPTGLERVIRDFKRSVSRLFGIRFQRGFFDTRIRDDTHYAEKFRYICNNPVRKGFCAAARNWRHVIAFDRDTGIELEHK